MASIPRKAQFILPWDGPAKVLAQRAIVHKQISVRLSRHCFGFLFCFLVTGLCL